MDLRVTTQSHLLNPIGSPMRQQGSQSPASNNAKGISPESHRTGPVNIKVHPTTNQLLSYAKVATAAPPERGAPPNQCKSFQSHDTQGIEGNSAKTSPMGITGAKSNRPALAEAASNALAEHYSGGAPPESSGSNLKVKELSFREKYQEDGDKPGNGTWLNAKKPDTSNQMLASYYNTAIKWDTSTACLVTDNHSLSPPLQTTHLSYADIVKRGKSSNSQGPDLQREEHPMQEEEDWGDRIPEITPISEGWSWEQPSMWIEQIDLKDTLTKANQTLSINSSDLSLERKESITEDSESPIITADLEKTCMDACNFKKLSVPSREMPSEDKSTDNIPVNHSQTEHPGRAMKLGRGRWRKNSVATSERCPKREIQSETMVQPENIDCRNEAIKPWGRGRGRGRGKKSVATEVGRTTENQLSVSAITCGQFENENSDDDWGAILSRYTPDTLKEGHCHNHFCPSANDSTTFKSEKPYPDLTTGYREYVKTENKYSDDIQKPSAVPLRSGCDTSQAQDVRRHPKLPNSSPQQAHCGAKESYYHLSGAEQRLSVPVQCSEEAIRPIDPLKMDGRPPKKRQKPSLKIYVPPPARKQPSSTLEKKEIQT